MSQNDKIIVASFGDVRRRETRAAAQAGILTGAVPKLYAQECAENDSLRALKAAQRGTLGYYRAEVARLRRNRPQLLQYVVIGLSVGVTLMAATWWIVDLILLEHHATMQYMDAALAVRTWILQGAVGFWAGWRVCTWHKRIGRTRKKDPGEAATSTEGGPNKSPSSYTGRCRMSSVREEYQHV